MNTPRPSPLWAYLQLLRLPNVFTAMADVTMGFLFTQVVFASGDGWVLAALIAASSLLYMAGVVLNDVFDLEIDARQRPDRPLPSGRISLAAARWLGWELLLLGVATGWLAGFLANDCRPGIVASLLALCVILYNAVLKRTVLGPLAMGACRLLNVLLGMSVLSDASGTAVPWRDEHWLVAGAIGIYIVGVTCFARTEARRSSRLQLTAGSLVMLSGMGLLSLLPRFADDVTPLLQQEPGRWGLLMTALALLIGFRALKAIVQPVPYRVQMAVKQCILSLIVLDAAACFVVCGTSYALIVLALLVPTVVLGRWIYST